MPDGFYLNSTQKQVVDFVNCYEKKYQEKPGFFEAVAYDTAMMVFQTSTQAEVKSRKELKDHMLSIRNYNGVTGLTSLKPTEKSIKNSICSESKRINL